MKLRRIKLSSLKNTRDLGNIPALEGKRIISHKLIRSGLLAKGKACDVNKLISDYNIKKVIDLRTDAEINEKPEVLPENVKYIRIPMLDDSYLGIARDEYSIQCWFNLFKDCSREPEEVFYDMYEMLVFSERSKKLIREIFDIFLADDEGSILWHCSAGKDRVGVVTMLLLTALGVKRDVIIEDFLATNVFTVAEILKMRIFSPFVIKERRLRKCLNILMTVKSMYLERIFLKIDKEYDDIFDFFYKQYGVSYDEIMKLREKYLQ